jgi:hypothetical protein
MSRRRHIHHHYHHHGPRLLSGPFVFWAAVVGALVLALTHVLKIVLVATGVVAAVVVAGFVVINLAILIKRRLRPGS